MDHNRERIQRNTTYLIERNHSTDSQDYEWDLVSVEFKELGVDVIHTYDTKIEVVYDSFVGLDELNLYVSLVDHIDHIRGLIDLGGFEKDLIDYELIFIRYYFYHIKNLEPSASLLLLHPKLIDWL